MEDQLWAVPSERRALVMLTQSDGAVQQLTQATLDEDIVNVLPRLNPLRPVVTVWNGDKLLGIVPPKLAPRAPRSRRSARGVHAGSTRDGQASFTAQSRLATGSWSLHGKLIHRSVRFQM